MEGGDVTRLEPHVSRRALLKAAPVGAITTVAGCLVPGEASEFSGQFVVDGSNTVLPHGAAVATEFMWRNNQVSIPVRGSGTGAGFQRFCAGETTFQNASRRVLPDEESMCDGSGVDWIELQVLLDGIAIMVHPDNDWIPEDEGLTVDELRAIWERDSAITTWSDVRDGWPDEKIALYGRDSASGTFDYFTEHITGDIGNIRRDYSGTPDTNVIVRGVRGNRYALGWGGAGYYYENEDDLRLVAVAEDADGPFVIPRRETIEDGTYQPLSRAMYLYVRTAALADPLVDEYARFFFREIDDDGYEEAERHGVLAPGETLLWTQYAARRVGFFGITDGWVEQAFDGQYDGLDAYVEDTLERAIEEANE